MLKALPCIDDGEEAVALFTVVAPFTNAKQEYENDIMLALVKEPAIDNYGIS